MYIKVRAITKAKKELVEKTSDDSFTIHVTQKPENNAANRRILEILHTYYKDTPIRIISGHHSPSKIISVD